jgi:ribosomal protein S18 acetylase RimI-like enzyme
MLRIRQAGREDADLIARMHAASWKDAYRNILPREYLDDDLEGERRRHWHKKMNELNDSDFVLIAEENDLPVGFISVWNEDSREYDAFIDNLHVLPGEKGNGKGSALMMQAAEMLVRSGKKSFYLWVLDQNVPARVFYERMGGTATDKSLFEIRGEKIPETRFVWADLNSFLKRKSVGK